jgi:GntR family transcriptional regulator/MocR family aminotransferase
VNESILRSCKPQDSVAGSAPPEALGPDWLQRLQTPTASRAEPRVPPNWRQYPHPFVDGLCDPSLFPTDEWRDASRLALSRSQIRAWATDGGDADDPDLIAEIRSKLLPRRGIRVHHLVA